MMLLSTLKTRKEFLRVARTKYKIKTSSFLLQFLPSIEQNIISPNFYVGFTASRKVGNAVKRNRAKRRLKELTRHFLVPYLDKLNVDKGHFVFIAFSSTAHVPFEQLKKDLYFAVKSCIDQMIQDSLKAKEI